MPTTLRGIGIIALTVAAAPAQAFAADFNQRIDQTPTIGSEIRRARDRPMCH